MVIKKLRATVRVLVLDDPTLSKLGTWNPHLKDLGSSTKLCIRVCSIMVARADIGDRSGRAWIGRSNFEILLRAVPFSIPLTP
jgi:hypothetical protein